ncbi:Wd Repeat-Containing Protein 27 [Manis pentadactyla]|nr:Wd Repeat-Containing Protein 27 [Manis pentadactyla]
MHFCMGDSLVTVVLKISYVLPTSPLYFIIVEEESTKPAGQKQSGIPDLSFDSKAPGTGTRRCSGTQ